MATTPLQQWVDALRSGEYTQTTKCLYDNYGMCCLGVASDLYPHGYWGDWDIQGYFFELDNDDGETEPYSEVGLLPAVADWLGLDNTLIPRALIKRYHPHVLPKLPDKYNNRQSVNLAVLNDSGATFNEIADLIEAHWIRGETE